MQVNSENLMYANTVRYQNGSLTTSTDPVITEKQIGLFINGQKFAQIMAMAEEIENLATGFLFSECIINNANEVETISFEPDSLRIDVTLTDRESKILSNRSRSITASNGKGIAYISEDASQQYQIIETKGTMSAKKVIEYMKIVESSSSLFKETGGVHSAAVASEKEILYCVDDIGRHNAVDKALGWLLNCNIDTNQPLALITTGRVSSEIVLKAIRGKFCYIISPSAPTSRAAELSTKHNITLSGFVRGNQFTIYSNSGRILE